MAQRVVDQVGHQGFDQARVARGGRRGQRGLEPDAQAPGLGAALLGDLAGQLGQVERFPLLHAALAAGQGQQRLDQAFLLIAHDQGFLAGGAERRGGGIGIGQRHLQQGPFGGQRGAQLMGSVGHEAPLRLERRLQPGEQAVQGSAEFGELVVAAAQGHPAAQVAGRDVPGGGGDRAQRAQEPARDQPARPEGQRRQGDQDGARSDDLVADVGIALRQDRRGHVDRQRGPDREHRDQEHHAAGGEEPGVEQGELDAQGAPGEAEPAPQGHHAAPIR